MSLPSRSQQDKGSKMCYIEDIKRVTIFAGHYGSGKTNLAINYALQLRRYFSRVAIADLDIVNPYFRTKDSEHVLRKSGVYIISSSFANSNVDLPSVPAEAYMIVQDTGYRIVVDVGGDDRGALVLGRYAPLLQTTGDYEMMFVINKYRPLTADGDSTAAVMREIEEASGLRFTGIINNSNLGPDTTAESVLESAAYADEISRVSGLPVKMTSVREDLFGPINGKLEGIFPIKLFHAFEGRFRL